MRLPEESLCLAHVTQLGRPIAPRRNRARKEMLSYTPPVMHQARAMRRLEHSRQPRRHDGWTPDRQLEFLDMLARTGSVTRSARAAGMSREGAYRLRSREPDGLFATAWDRAVTPAHRRPTRAEIDEGHIRAIAAACGTEGAGLRRRLARESTS